MKFKKLIPIATGALLLAGCQVAGIKIIDKTSVATSSDSFEHASYIFNKKTGFASATKSTALVNKLTNDGEVKAELKEGDVVKLLFSDSTDRIIYVEHEGQELYAQAKDFEITKEEPKKDTKAIDALMTDAQIKEITDLISKKKSELDVKKFTKESIEEAEKILSEIPSDLSKEKSEKFADFKLKIESIKLAEIKKEEPAQPATPTPERPETPAQSEPAPAPEKPKDEEKPKQEQPQAQPAPQGDIKYPAAPEELDIIDGITFAIINVDANVLVPIKLYDGTAVGSNEVASLNAGDEVKVIAIGTNGFAKVQTKDGKLGFMKGEILKKK